MAIFSLDSGCCEAQTIATGLLRVRKRTLRIASPRIQDYDKRMIRTFQGKTPLVPASCYVDASAQVLGEVELGEQASVWMNAVLRGDVNSIRIGARSNVQDCAVLHGMRSLYPVVVGEMVTIGHNATVHGCVLEDAVLVGIGAVILNGARIGEGSIIAAGAVIPERTIIPPNSLVAGVPGKIRRTLGDVDREMILMYARNYLDYTKIYLAESEITG
jgi:carbonic anhydrase/acetyltransferase-like protein (isoleucine patch superfamily)